MLQMLQIKVGNYIGSARTRISCTHRDLLQKTHLQLQHAARSLEVFACTESSVWRRRGWTGGDSVNTDVNTRSIFYDTVNTNPPCGAYQGMLQMLRAIGAVLYRLGAITHERRSRAMKRYAAWGLDRSYRWKWMARLAQWWKWRNVRAVS